MATDNHNVLLLSNYLPDRQYSMQRFTMQLAEGLIREGLEVEIYPVPTVFGHLGASGSGLGKWIGYIDKYLLFPFLLKRKLRQLAKQTIVHIIDHSNAPYTRWLGASPHLVTCHDLLAIRCARGEVPQHRPKWTGKQQQAMILRGLKQSQCIASVSEATHVDVARLVGPREAWSHVIPNALNEIFINRARQTTASSLPAKPLRGEVPEECRYVMHIGGEKWYKNRKAVLEIFSRLAPKDPQLQLVIVGPAFSDAAITETGCSGLKERICYLSGIEDEDLCDLYAGAELLLFPSFVEGFGWPILEAQACGCAVSTLSAEPMRSLNAVEALKIGTANRLDAVADAAWHYMQSSEAHKSTQRVKMKAFAAQFTNEASAKAYLELYRQLISR